MPRPAFLLAALLLVPGLGGCMEAGTSRYPSLLPRPIESQSLAEPERPVPVAEPDPALDATIADTLRTLDASTGDFTAAAQNAEAMIAVARGVPEGSEAWLNAQTALSDLQSRHGPVLTTLARLEGLAIARGEAGKPPYPALTDAQARASAVSDAQEARIAGLEAALSGN